MAHLLDEFHGSPQKWFSRKSQSWGSVRAEPWACRSTGPWFRGFSKTMVASMCPQCHPLILARLQHFLEENAATAWFCHFKRHQHPRDSSWPAPCGATLSRLAGKPQTQAGQAADGGLHQGGIILAPVGALGCSAVRS